MASGTVNRVFQPTEYDFNEEAVSTSPITAYYNVSGNGYLIVTASNRCSNTSDTGQSACTIYRAKRGYGSVEVAYGCTRLGVANTAQIGVSVTAALAVSDGDTIRITLSQTKGSSTDIFRHFLCFGCSVSTS